MLHAYCTTCLVCVHILFRDQSHLVPVNYGRPAAAYYRPADNVLGRLKVTVAQVNTCTCACRLLVRESFFYFVMGPDKPVIPGSSLLALIMFLYVYCVLHCMCILCVQCIKS